MEKKRAKVLNPKIKGLIEQGESERLEFKENFDKETIETAVAFANTQGGMIILGVGEGKTVKGVALGTETLKKWINEISQNTEPTIVPEIESQTLDHKLVVSIKIGESPLKPVSYRGRCFQRFRNSNRKLSPREISELHLQTIGSSWDSYPLPEASLNDIDLNRVKEYIQLANETGRRRIKEKPFDVLKKLELVKRNKPTRAAILLFGKEPQRFILQAKVHCGRFKTDTEVIDDLMINGTLFEQVDEALAFVKKHLKLKFEMTGEARRKEGWEYPLPAIREAVINAIVHRDYTIPSDVQIRIYDDKLIVWGVGKLPPGISKEELLRPHNSVLRNKQIAQVFFDAGLIERWGTGIGKIILACKQEGLPAPAFEERDGFLVIFQRNILTEEILKELSFRQQKIIQFLKEHQRISTPQCASLLEVSADTALRELSALRIKGLIEQRGTGKSIYYALR